MNASIRQIVHALLASAASVFLAGCITTATTHETRRPAQAVRVTTVEASEQASTIAVPADVRASFARLLDEQLYTKGGFQRGPELKIRWQFSEFDEGSRALRYFVGFGAGKGRIAVHATFLDAKGREVAAVDGFGTVVMGAFGGSYETALRECAFEVAKYAKTNFLVAWQR